MRVMVAGVAVAAAVLVGGCGGSSSSSAENGGGAQGIAPAKAPVTRNAADGQRTVLGDAVAGSAGSANGQGGTIYEASLQLHRLPRLPSTVIKTGRLAITLKHGDVAATVGDANTIAAEFGGYVTSSETTDGKHPRATVVIRVPAARFPDAISKLRGLGGGTVRSEQITGEDVGQEFVDLGARERNLVAQARALRRLMGRAVTVDDTIRVQNQLFDIQGQIEELQGRLRYLHDQADLSTITVVVSEAAAAHHHHQGQATAIGSAFRRGWDRAVGVVTAVIAGAGLVIPVAVLALLALLAAWRVWPPLHRRIAAAAAKPDPTAAD